MTYKNEKLNEARRRRFDDFRTTYGEVERELEHYKDYFKGKTVLCNANDADSEFQHYFAGNFDRIGLKRLVCTHYNKDGSPSYMVEMTGKEGPKTVSLDGNGDFRSKECVDLMREADVVVTNPPFSCFYDFMNLLEMLGKKYLVLGNLNAISYSWFFPLIQQNRIRTGYTAGEKIFKAGDDYCNPSAVMEDGEMIMKFHNVRWYTNLEVESHRLPLELSKTYAGHKCDFPSYDNCQAIEVSRVKNIPADYDGVMGVPISYLDKHCPSQFEIIGTDYEEAGPVMIGNRLRPHPQRFYLDGKKKYARILIRRKQG